MEKMLSVPEEEDWMMVSWREGGLSGEEEEECKIEDTKEVA